MYGNVFTFKDQIWRIFLNYLLRLSLFFNYSPFLQMPLFQFKQVKDGFIRILKEFFFLLSLLHRWLHNRWNNRTAFFHHRKFFSIFSGELFAILLCFQIRLLRKQLFIINNLLLSLKTSISNTQSFNLLNSTSSFFTISPFTSFSCGGECSAMQVS